MSLTVAAIWATMISIQAPPKNGANKNYVSNRRPLAQSALIKLPTSSFQPGGWLRANLERQRNGLSGHLGEISKWLTKTNNAWLNENGLGDFGWEEVPYWLRGYARIGVALNDKSIFDESKVWTEGALQSQRSTGDFGPIRYHKPGKRDLWPQMLMLQHLQAGSENTGDGRVLPFMSRYFKWQLTLRDEDFLKDYWENSRGGDNLASVYWLYNRTGEAFLLELATKIDRVSANWRQVGNLPNWHNVNIAENFHAPAVYGLQSKKPADTRAAYENFDLIRTKFGQVPGGMFGADENARTGYDDPHQATETCGIVEQLGSNLAMAAITADPKWIANSEDVAFNSLPAAFMPDYRALRYLTAPNQVLSDAANHAPGIANDGSFMLMNPFSSRCCQHNHTSGWTNFLESTWMATQDNGLAALIFTEGIVSAKVAGGQIVKVSTKTRYPFEGNIQMKVLTIKSAKFPIYLLIPDWANSPVIKINGAESPVKAGKFVRIDRTWKNGDQIEIKLPMEPRIHEWKKMKNSASVSVGPLTFSLKIGEQYTKIDGLKFTQQDSGWKPGVDQSNWPTHEITPTTEWNFGIQKGSTLSVIRKPWPKNNFPFTHEACPIELQMMGKQIPEWKLDKHGLAGVLPLSPVAVTGPSVPLTLIPMGAARLRISSFPQVK